MQGGIAPETEGPVKRAIETTPHGLGSQIINAARAQVLVDRLNSYSKRHFMIG